MRNRQRHAAFHSLATSLAGVLAFSLILATLPVMPTQAFVPNHRWMVAGSGTLSTPAATITVKSSADSGGACPSTTCTLRQAIATAAAGDTIDFDMATVTSPITLASELAVNKNLTITGPGASMLTVSGNNAVRVLNIGTGIVNV